MDADPLPEEDRRRWASVLSQAGRYGEALDVWPERGDELRRAEHALLSGQPERARVLLRELPPSQVKNVMTRCADVVSGRPEALPGLLQAAAAADPDRAISRLVAYAAADVDDLTIAGLAALHAVGEGLTDPRLGALAAASLAADECYPDAVDMIETAQDMALAGEDPRSGCLKALLAAGHPGPAAVLASIGERDRALPPERREAWRVTATRVVTPPRVPSRVWTAGWFVVLVALTLGLGPLGFGLALAGWCAWARWRRLPGLTREESATVRSHTAGNRRSAELDVWDVLALLAGAGAGLVAAALAASHASTTVLGLGLATGLGLGAVAAVRVRHAAGRRFATRRDRRRREQDLGCRCSGIRGFSGTATRPYVENHLVTAPASGAPASGVPESGVPESGVPKSGVPESGVPGLPGPVLRCPDTGVTFLDLPAVNLTLRVPSAGSPVRDDVMTGGFSR